MYTNEQFDSVLGAARANVEWAWHDLYAQFAPTVLQFLRAQRADLPEDLLGEVFLDVVRSLHTFTGGPAEFRSWLFRIAQNRFLDERRARARRPDLPAAEIPDSAVRRAPGADETVHIREDEARLYRMLAALPDDQRAAVFMRVALEMQPAEIASVMQRRVGAVKMLLHRGLATLQQRLAGDLDINRDDSPGPSL